jgi:hypothetical protein
MEFIFCSVFDQTVFGGSRCTSAPIEITLQMRSYCKVLYYIALSTSLKSVDKIAIRHDLINQLGKSLASTWFILFVLVMVGHMPPIQGIIREKTEQVVAAR